MWQNTLLPIKPKHTCILLAKAFSLDANDIWNLHKLRFTWKFFFCLRCEIADVKKRILTKVHKVGIFCIFLCFNLLGWFAETERTRKLLVGHELIQSFTSIGHKRRNFNHHRALIPSHLLLAVEEIQQNYFWKKKLFL